jgi:hypothetical protein
MKQRSLLIGGNEIPQIATLCDRVFSKEASSLESNESRNFGVLDGKMRRNCGEAGVSSTLGLRMANHVL